MAFSLQITKPDGSVIANPLTQPKTTSNLVSGDMLRIVDKATGKSPPTLRARKPR